MVGDASCYAIYLYKTLEAVNAQFNPYQGEITAANVSIITPEQAREEQAAREEAEKEELPEEELPEEFPEELLPPEEELPGDWPFDEEFPWEDFFPEEDDVPQDGSDLPQEDIELPEEGSLPTDDWVTNVGGDAEDSSPESAA